MLLGKKKILLVDDEEALLEILSSRLKFAGYEVFTANSGEAAIDLLKKNNPHMVILDIMMPGMDGFSVLGKLKENPKTRSIVVVMLTSKGDASSIRKAISLGAADYIIKPFTPAILLEKIKRILKTGKP